ncbi:MAG: hypothetical protein ACLR06_11835 [Christensenellaceae bacterium]
MQKKKRSLRGKAARSGKPDKDTERLERERLKKINKLPDYEALVPGGRARKTRGRRISEKDFPQGLGAPGIFVADLHTQGCAFMGYAARHGRRH